MTSPPASLPISSGTSCSPRAPGSTSAGAPRWTRSRCRSSNFRTPESRSSGGPIRNRTARILVGRPQGSHGAAALYRQLFDRLVDYHKLRNLVWVWNARRVRVRSQCARRLQRFLSRAAVCRRAGHRRRGRQLALAPRRRAVRFRRGKGDRPRPRGRIPAPAFFDQQSRWAWSWPRPPPRNRPTPLRALYASPASSAAQTENGDACPASSGLKPPPAAPSSPCTPGCCGTGTSTRPPGTHRSIFLLRERHARGLSFACHSPCTLSTTRSSMYSQARRDASRNRTSRESCQAL